VFKRVDIGYYAFEPGDTLLEFFSMDRWYNAFATFRATGEFVGWYCNVTYPTIVDFDTRELRWHDLWVDILVLPDGKVIVVDEDELADSGLATTDPSLHATILGARDELLALIDSAAYPFSEVPSTPDPAG
jgi:protein associated with RNAse G/E